MNPFGRRVISRTADFERIRNLARRGPVDAEALAREMTQALKTPNGTMTLRPVQALALYELMTTGGGFFPIGVGVGKCLGKDTPVLMFDGTIKMVQDIVEGDLLMGPDSCARRVVSTCRGVEALYRVTPTKGDSYVVNESHILSLKQTRLGGYPCASTNGGRVLNLEVRDFLDRSSKSRKFRTNWKGWRVGVEFPSVNVLEPYMLGVWLGDGSTNTPSITSADEEIVSEIFEFAKRFGVDVRVQSLPDNASKTYHFTTSSRPGRGGWNSNSVTSWLRGVGVFGNKHVPHTYKVNSRDVRLHVLAGILDTDGSRCGTGFDFISSLEGLADDVCFIARSLGLAAYKTPCRKTCGNNGVSGNYFRVSISGDCSIIPTRIARKRAPKRVQKKSVLMTGISVSPMGEGEYFGFEISGPDRLFLLGDFTVTHNTLIFFLAPVVLDLRRAVGLLPASLLDKSEKERVDLAEHWRVDRSMQLYSYEMLGRVNASTFLETRMPDGIVTDESHRLKNTKAACTRRVARFLRENPDVKSVFMSGTMIKNSVRDFAHSLRWALTAEKAPIPTTTEELGEWADCLDERVNPLQRVKPGPLAELSPKKDAEGDELSLARKAFHERLVSTPGVVCSLSAEQVDCSIYIEGNVLKVNETTEENFKTLRKDWETPDGWALSEAVDVWRHARELSIGLHYVWDPRPPDEWLSARRAWAKFVRDTLSRSRSLDSEKQVALACESGELPDDDYRAWLEIKDTFKINQKAVWHDDSALNLCAKWLEKEKGICWVDHTFFGRELAKRTGIPYFGQNGLDDQGNSLVDLARAIANGEKKLVPIIASVAANGTGKNLQPWSKNLITSCPTGASIWEQLLGRTHRPGQKADEVTVEVLIGCIENVEAWERAVSEAKMSSDMLGQPQKILVADVSMPNVTVLPIGSRWEKSANTP